MCDIINKDGGVRMRTINIDSLPRHKGGKNKGSIDWQSSIGHTLNFTYDDVQGELTFIGLGKRGMIIIDYNGEEHTINKESLKRCQFQFVLKKVTKGFRYNVGEIVTTRNGMIKILSTLRHNGYKKYQVECCLDGHRWVISEDSLRRGGGCGACSNKVVVKGINNVGHTHPWVKKYLVDENDGDIYTYGSKKLVQTKCPNCGVMKNQSFDNLTKQGFCCPKCGDGVSFPNKLIYNVLSQTSLNFIWEYVPNWGSGKRYDFYLVDENIIIEVDGEQHFKQRGKNSKFKPLSYEMENDRYKEELAIQNGISNYVHIDARYSRLAHIKNSFDNTILFDLTKDYNIDWQLAFEKSIDSLVKNVCDYYNEHKDMSTNDIGKVFHLAYATVRKYLMMGVELGWCDYCPKEAQKQVRLNNAKKYGKRVLCVTNNKVYNSQKEASREIEKEYGIKTSASQIRDVCKGKHAHTKGLIFKYID